MSKRIALAELSHLIDEVLSIEIEVLLTVTGNSMAPFLRDGRDKVRIAKVGREPLKKYDIPFYRRPDGKYVLHRIIAVKKEGYVIAGDNQVIKEYPIPHSCIFAVVKGVWRNGKYISSNHIGYRLYCWLWVSLFPIRVFNSKAGRFCYRLKEILNKNNCNPNKTIGKGE